MSKSGRYVLCAAIVLSLTGSPVKGQLSAVPPNPNVTSLFVSVEGDVTVGDDTVHLSGEVHVLTKVMISSDSPTIVSVHANLARVDGISAVTGISYVAVGAGSTEVTLAPGPPSNVNNLPAVQFNFMLVAAGPSPFPFLPPSLTLPVSLSNFQWLVDVDTLGTLVGVEASIPNMAVVGPRQSLACLVPSNGIFVDGNEGFAAFAATGDGTASSPYVIENLRIETGGIRIRNTDAYFIIRNVCVQLDDLLEPGITLYNVSNGIVEHSSSSTNRFGVEVLNSSSILLRGNKISDNEGGEVVVWQSTEISLEANHVSDSGLFKEALLVYNSEMVAIDGNEFVHKAYGIVVVGSSGVRIRDNLIRRNLGPGLLPTAAFGITVGNSGNLTISGNVLKDHRLLPPFEKDICPGCIGVELAASATNARVFHNWFIHNLHQANDFGVGNVWDDGYPSGGNYWSDYSGVDTCSGPFQNICPDPDGIGDSPYLVDNDTVDRYPLKPRLRARALAPLGEGRSVVDGN